MTGAPLKSAGFGPPDLSIVIPCLNEEENVEAIAAAVSRECESQSVRYEIVFIDNASTDNTVKLIKELAAGDRRIKLIVNARNFGQLRSPTHGIFCASGRAVIGMCADFQDPPEMIGPLVEHWRRGAQIVLCVRESERGSLWKRFARWAGYAFLSRFADYPVIRDATGFGLYDRRVVDCLAQWNEPEPFFRGMLVESGFPIVTISYPRVGRRAGRSKNDFLRYLEFALSAVSNSSRRILRLPFALAAMTALFAGFTAIVAVILGFLGKPFAYLVYLSIVEIQLALLFAVLGFMGDQIRLIAERTRNVPLVIERERVNFDIPQK